MSEQWCNNCQRATKQEMIMCGANDNIGNAEYKCEICGYRNYTIQGFNMNLM